MLDTDCLCSRDESCYFSEQDRGFAEYARGCRIGHLASMSPEGKSDVTDVLVNMLCRE